MNERLTLREAAQRFGIAPTSLRQAARLGRLEAEKVGDGPRATYFVTPAAVERYLESRPEWIKRREAVKKERQP